MKKTLMVGLMVMAIVSLMVIPVLAGLDDIDEIDGFVALSISPCSSDGWEQQREEVWGYSRFDLIDENAFRGTTGINVVQMSAGNGNILQDNKDITALADASDADLMVTAAVSFAPCSYDLYNDRFDRITDNAFRGSVGMNTAQLSSGNGNILQSSLSLQVGPGVAQEIVN